MISIKIVAWLLRIVGIAATGMVIWASLALASWGGDIWHQPILKQVLFILTLIGVVIVFVVPAFFIASRLQHRDRWAYKLTITLSILGLFVFPYGTVAGIIILVLLLRKNVRLEFNATQPPDQTLQ